MFGYNGKDEQTGGFYGAKRFFLNLGIKALRP